MRIVVFGWGNDARGDDGLGPLLLGRVTEAGWPELTTIEDFQLQIEHALDLDGAEMALFLDAGKDTPAPFTFVEIGPRWVGTPSTHAIAPESVLEVYARTLGKPPPPSFTLCVRGETFELSEGLSAEAAERLETAWTFLEALMGERTVEAWRRAVVGAAMPRPPDGPGGRPNESARARAISKF